jgi:hypothetical protein
MNIIERLKELGRGFENQNFWGGGNAGNALLAESVENAGKDIRAGLEALAEALQPTTIESMPTFKEVDADLQEKINKKK